MKVKESVVEEAALLWFGDLGYTSENGLHLAPGEIRAERSSLANIASGPSDNGKSCVAKIVMTGSTRTI